ncbi:MAG TPA: N-acetylmuramoyl-L-alanine amidase [Ruminiclostridium sp.]
MIKKASVKKILLVLVMGLILTTFFSTKTFATQLPISVMVNESKLIFIKEQPFIDSNGRTQTPAAFIGEKLGATVIWNGEEQKAVFTLGETVLILFIGKKDYMIDGKMKQMDTTAIIKGDRTFVPAKYIAEAFGANVTWDGATRTVHVYTSGTPIPQDPIPEKPIKNPINVDLTYSGNFDRTYFSLKGINLASVGSKITNYFTEEYDIENNKYTIIIPSGSAICLADKTFNINNSQVSTIEIYRDKVTSDTKMVFHTKKQFKFYTSYNEKRKQTEINLLTPAKEDERLVVIDAGHGGIDPGANSNSVYEKNLNLAIALKLEVLLKAKNIKTFMLRQDDTFVGLYDRPYIANALNATLFMCIHNNAIDSSKTMGTETLYNPEMAGDTSFSGLEFARIIQDSLISKLKTVNRKTVERQGLVVLKYTKMPACLAEVGFLTNPTELKNLSSQEYQLKTAEALCDGIVKSLALIELEKKAKTALEIEKKAKAALELQENSSGAAIELENNANANTDLQSN